MRASRSTEAAANVGSSTASRKLLPIARSATFGSPINLITVFGTRSWSVLSGEVCAESAGSRSLFSARRRLGLKEEGTEPAPVVTEEALYKP